MDPTNIGVFRKIHMHVHVTADELWAFIHCCHSMAISLPNFSRTAKPLVSILGETYCRSVMSTKRPIKLIQLHTLSRSVEQIRSFNHLQDSITNAATISYPEAEKLIFIYTNASERFWSTVVTQNDQSQLSRPIQDPEHSPLAFLVAKLKGGELKCSTFDKERFAIFLIYSKLDYLFMDQHSKHLFTYHRSFISFSRRWPSSLSSEDTSYRMFNDGYFLYPLLTRTL